MKYLLIMLFLINSAPAWAEDPLYPDPTKTPGTFFTDATLDKICQKGYTATVRHVTEGQRNKVFKHLLAHQGVVKYDK